MALSNRTIELTRAFYAWELRGRGWARYSAPVALEPPFSRFERVGAASPERRDDARRHTWLSALVEGFRIVEESPVAELELEAESEPEFESALTFDEFVISVPADMRIDSNALFGWLQSFSTVASRASFELVGGSRRVEVRLAVPKSESSHVVGQLRGAIPTLTAVETGETLEGRWAETAGPMLAVLEFGLSSEFMIPLSSAARVEEPLLPLIAALADVDEGELGVFQVLFEQTRSPWAASIRRAVLSPNGQPFFADAPEITSFASDKTASPLFAVSVRLGSLARSSERAWEIVRRVASGLSQLGSPSMNELMPLSTDDVTELEADLVRRTNHRSGMLLSASELVSLVHLPGAGVQVPELWRVQERTKQAPLEASGSGCFLGYNVHDGESTAVRLSVDTKTKHAHLVGASGTGKSTLLVKMILEDIEAGHGVGVLDPHGDLIAEVAARVPESRVSDVVLFDPSDDGPVVGWNILGAESEVEKDLLASDLVGVFRRLSTSWGDQMTAVLANAIMVFLESPRRGTLVELRQFLIDGEFRKDMLATVADPHVRSFWEVEFPLLIGRRPQAPILTRLDTFLRSKLIRRIVTVKQPKLDFRQVTDDGLIFLGKLAAGAIGEHNAALLGSLLVSKFHQVTLARESQAVEERRPFFLYIDEFHHVATSSMAGLFSGVRKYRLGLTVAHQDLYQLHASVPEVERSLMANAYTQICFRVGEQDAR